MPTSKQTRSRTRPGALVLNTPAAPTINEGVFTSWKIEINAGSKLVRNDKMEGREFTVVPMVMMVEGVHAGSGGALYYPKDELSKTPAVWNMKPVVVYHPTKDGKGVSACSPDVVNTHKIGVIMNAKWDKGERLVAEAWIENARADEVDKRVMKAVKAGKMMELSTGLFTDNEDTAGEFEGEKYVAIARNYRPDHLALLPDQTGACSIKDGAGFLRNSAAENKVQPSDEVIESQLRRLSYEMGLVGNELSYQDVINQLDKLLREKFKNPLKPNDWVDVWVTDVYEDDFVYTHQRKLYRQGYAKGATKVVLDGEPEEVVRVTKYEKVKSPAVINSQPNQTMNKDAKIAALISNAKSGFTADHKTFLEGCTDTQLDAFTANSAAPAAPAAIAAAAPAANTAAPAPAAKPTPELNAEDRAALDYGKQQLAANRAKAIETIKANKSNTLDDATLAAMPLNSLEAVAKLAAVPAPATNAAPAAAPYAPLFAGQAPAAPTANGAPVDNSAQPVLTTPVYDWGTKGN